MRPHPDCNDTDPELFAGEPMDDGWDERTAVAGEPLPPVPDSAYPADAVPLEEVTDDGELDSGSVPGESAN